MHKLNQLFLIFLCIFCISGCLRSIPDQKITSNKQQMETTMINSEKAQEIAENDAKNVYKDLSIYKVSINLEGENWKVDYDLKDSNALGGGPHYIISGKTGEIINRRYEQ